ncbi:hypothetical protein I4U23_025737 [Adineta vaga]|nr:hypothetical protein I4U23_025737 [Adineta vaga]
MEPLNRLHEQPNVRRRKLTKKNRTIDLTCVVCGNVAYGYNFDAVSCESCKAFFRRNALRAPGKLKCPQDNHCNTRFDEKKRCKKCRLAKCFVAGMRKEWILTETEKESKRRRIEENRRLREYQEFEKNEIIPHDKRILSVSPIFKRNYLTKTDVYKIKHLQNAYRKAVRLNQIIGISKYPSIQSIGSTMDLFSIPLLLSSMRLITYFKHICEFQQLTIDEQVHLVKLNTLAIVFLHSIVIYDAENVNYHEPYTNDPIFLETDWIKTINKEFHQQIKQIRIDLNEIHQIDGQIMIIFFLIILFSNDFVSKSSSTNFNTLNIYKAQSIYNELFWKYSLDHYGLPKSLKLYLQYVNSIMKIEKLISELRLTIHNHLDITKLSTLMQSLL